MAPKTFLLQCIETDMSPFIMRMTRYRIIFFIVFKLAIVSTFKMGTREIMIQPVAIVIIRTYPGNNQGIQCFIRHEMLHIAITV